MIDMPLFSVFADSSLSDPQFWIGVGSLVLSAAAILVTVVIAARSRQKRLLTYEITSNSSVVNLDKDVSSSSTVSLQLNGRSVTNLRVFVIKLLNAGNTSITPQDYPDNPSFEFSSPPYGNPLISCEIQDTGVGAKLPIAQVRKMLSIDPTDQSAMILRPPLLNPRDFLSLRVLVTADKRDSTTMSIRGQIKDGEIKQYAPPRHPLTGRAIIIGVCLAFVLGILISSFPLITAYAQGNCVLGSIKVVGSTSFAPTVQTEQTNYNTLCPSVVSNITMFSSLDSSGSNAGLTYVENGNGQIADSEIPSPYHDLVDHQVGVVVFALIVNKSLLEKCNNFLNLDLLQLQQIYSDGVALEWDSFASTDPTSCLPHEQIRVVEREGSGTQASFANYVLQETFPEAPAGALFANSSYDVVSKVAANPGAIGFADLSDIRSNGSVAIVDIHGSAPTAVQVERGEYPFWAVEHMYTRQSPNALATSFITFVIGHLQTSDAVISCLDMTSAAFSPPHDDTHDTGTSCQSRASG